MFGMLKKIGDALADMLLYVYSRWGTQLGLAMWRIETSKMDLFSPQMLLPVVPEQAARVGDPLADAAEEVQAAADRRGDRRGGVHADRPRLRPHDHLRRRHLRIRRARIIRKAVAFSFCYLAGITNCTKSPLTHPTGKTSC